MLPTKFRFIWQAVTEDMIFRNRPIRNKNCIWQPYLRMDRDEMSSIYRGPPIDASYQVSVHMEKRFQRRRILRNQPIRNKNCLWRPCLLTDREEMCNRNRKLSMDVSYPVSVHLAKRFQKRILKIYLLTDRDKMSNLYSGPSIDDSYQVSVHLAEGFQRTRLKCEKLTDDGRHVMAKAHVAFGTVS